MVPKVTVRPPSGRWTSRSVDKGGGTWAQGWAHARRAFSSLKEHLAMQSTSSPAHFTVGGTVFMASTSVSLPGLGGKGRTSLVEENNARVCITHLVASYPYTMHYARLRMVFVRITFNCKFFLILKIVIFIILQMWVPISNALSKASAVLSYAILPLLYHHHHTYLLIKKKIGPSHLAHTGMGDLASTSGEDKLKRVISPGLEGGDQIKGQLCGNSSMTISL
jgi:hypothetical protein